MNSEEKELYARLLAARAERSVKAIKILFFVLIAVAFVTVVYAVTIAATGFIRTNTAGALGGFAALIGVAVALFIAVAACFITAKTSLNKLKNLN